jgi:isovaleryl-CoA dehydrogenase
MSAFPELDLGLSENARMIRDSAGRFADDKIAPLSQRVDAEDWFPRHELWAAMGELGLHGITVEEEWGGLGLGYLEHVVAQEEISAGPPRLACLWRALEPLRQPDPPLGQ